MADLDGGGRSRRWSGMSPSDAAPVLLRARYDGRGAVGKLASPFEVEPCGAGIRDPAAGGDIFFLPKSLSLPVGATGVGYTFNGAVGLGLRLLLPFGLDGTYLSAETYSVAGEDKTESRSL